MIGIDCCIIHMLRRQRVVQNTPLGKSKSEDLSYWQHMSNSCLVLIRISNTWTCKLDNPNNNRWPSYWSDMNSRVSLFCLLSNQHNFQKPPYTLYNRWNILCKLFLLKSLKNFDGQSGPQEFKFLFRKFPSTHWKHCVDNAPVHRSQVI